MIRRGSNISHTATFSVVRPDCTALLLSAMKNVFLLSLFSLILINCDDGDIITTQFEFDNQTLRLCEDNSPYLFYNIESDTNESLILLLQTGEPILTDPGDYSFTIGATNTLQYRVYDNEIPTDFFCQTLPPSTPIVTTQYDGNGGSVSVVNDLLQEDSDGISTGFEIGDTDGDGLPDAIDEDDDGDNVPTNEENADPNGDGNPDDAQDTDGDGIPDYLDSDDDNDGIPTIQEDANGDLNPQNDSSSGTAPDYLNDQVAIAVVPAINMYIEHSYSVRSIISFTFLDVIFEGQDETIIDEVFPFGTYTTSQSTVTITPTF